MIVRYWFWLWFLNLCSKSECICENYYLLCQISMVEGASFPSSPVVEFFSGVGGSSTSWWEEQRRKEWGGGDGQLFLGSHRWWHWEGGDRRWHGRWQGQTVAPEGGRAAAACLDGWWSWGKGERDFEKCYSVSQERTACMYPHLMVWTTQWCRLHHL